MTDRLIRITTALAVVAVASSLIVAAIGVVVRVGDWARVLLARWPTDDRDEPASPRRGYGGELP